MDKRSIGVGSGIQIGSCLNCLPDSMMGLPMSSAWIKDLSRRSTTTLSRSQVMMDLATWKALARSIMAPLVIPWLPLVALWSMIDLLMSSAWIMALPSPQLSQDLK
jgi:hypothetical protein